MSIEAMNAVWGIPLPDSQKIVLLALADWADHDGRCWPSVATIAAKCSKGERTVQAVIKELVAAGHITREEVVGKGCRYVIHPRKDRTPANSAPPQGTAQTPAAAAPNTPRTTNKKPKEARAHVLPDGWWPAEFGLKTKSRATVDGWPPGELETQVEHFTAHHRKTGQKWEDWQAAWSTWVLNSAKFNRKPNHERKPANNDEIQNSVARRVIARQAARAAAVGG